MSRIFLLTAISVGLLAPAAADAAVIHDIPGRGFGHGAGMSQYGAFGLAQNGRGYREILAHYYTGTQLSEADTRTIRVLLQGPRKSVTFDGATAVAAHTLDPNRVYRATPSGLSHVTLRDDNGDVVDRFQAPLQVSSSLGMVRLRGTAINGLRDGRYRGALELRPSTFASGLLAVNAVGLDDYVQGVVPEEVPPSWHPEALKAQSVAARSYALTTDAGGPVFDQYPDTRSQVYRGVDREEPQTNAAVQATAGEVLRYNGQIATTFFFSTSGGRTENIENVFYNAAPKPYLKSVRDPFDRISPRHRWRFRFSNAQMQAKLSGLVKGRFRRIKVVDRGVSPRVVWADVYGSRGRTRVRGATLRTRLGLHDTWASFKRVRTSTSSARARSSAFRGRIPGSLAARGRVFLVEGDYTPVPRRRLLALQRQTGSGKWRTVRRLRTTRAGAYRATVGPGTYRVLAQGTAGPTVRAG
jgi:stage II sporulation protein D